MKLRIMAAGAGAVAAGLVGILPAASAQAATTTVPGGATASTSASLVPGYLYAWTETYRHGATCRWLGPAADWGGCKNNVGSVQNNGTTAAYDDVNLYWGTGYVGAYACLGRGDMWLDLSIKRETFDHRGSVDGYKGIGQPLYNNIASHKWVQHC